MYTDREKMILKEYREMIKEEIKARYYEEQRKRHCLEVAKKIITIWELQKKVQVINILTNMVLMFC